MSFSSMYGLKMRVFKKILHFQHNVNGLEVQTVCTQIMFLGTAGIWSLVCQSKLTCQSTLESIFIISIRNHCVSKFSEKKLTTSVTYTTTAARCLFKARLRVCDGEVKDGQYLNMPNLKSRNQENMSLTLMMEFPSRLLKSHGNLVKDLTNM